MRGDQGGKREVQMDGGIKGSGQNSAGTVLSLKCVEETDEAEEVIEQEASTQINRQNKRKNVVAAAQERKVLSDSSGSSYVSIQF